MFPLNIYLHKTIDSLAKQSWGGGEAITSSAFEPGRSMPWEHEFLQLLDPYCNESSSLWLKPSCTHYKSFVGRTGFYIMIRIVIYTVEISVWVCYVTFSYVMNHNVMFNSETMTQRNGKEVSAPGSHQGSNGFQSSRVRLF